jgi:putative nucleotidyltransferase with HDIG domain
MKLDALLAQPQALPPAPKVAGRLIETLDDPSADLNSLAQLIETDPVLTAKIIRQANSAFFGLLRPVAHPREAIAMLGLVKVRAMALAALLQDGFHHTSGIDLEMFWRYSLTTANLARYVAAPLGVDDNAVYTAGLIHAIGELVMHVGMPEAMVAVNARISPFHLRRSKAEAAQFGYHYANVGAALARQWRFPKRMVAGLENHLDPFEHDSIEPIAAVIHLAAWRARVEFTDMDLSERIGSYPDAVGVALGVDPDAISGDNIPALQLARDGFLG